MQNGTSGLDALGGMMDEGKNAHEILGLPLNASGVEVREAYIRLAKKYHPDAHPNDLAAERRFKQIARAYNELRSSSHFRGLQNGRAPKFWGSHRQALAVAFMFVALTSSAIVLVKRSGEEAVPSPMISRVEGGASPGSGLAAPEANSPQYATEAHSSPEAAPLERTGSIIPGFQAPSLHDEIAAARAEDTLRAKGQDDWNQVASAQSGAQDKREPGVDVLTPPPGNRAAAERTGKKSIVALKTNTAAINVLGKKQGLRPELAVHSARAALLEHSLDRTVLAAAPGG